nr:hypothetical protein CFP56_00974 [Quercus suber]
MCSLAAFFKGSYGGCADMGKLVPSKVPLLSAEVGDAPVSLADHFLHTRVSEKSRGRPDIRAIAPLALALGDDTFDFVQATVGAGSSVFDDIAAHLPSSAALAGLGCAPLDALVGAYAIGLETCFGSGPLGSQRRWEQHVIGTWRGRVIRGETGGAEPQWSWEGDVKRDEDSSSLDMNISEEASRQFQLVTEWMMGPLPCAPRTKGRYSKPQPGDCHLMRGRDDYASLDSWMDRPGWV